MEKFDKEIANRIAKTLRKLRIRIRHKFEYAIQTIGDAKSIADVMEAKQELMSGIVMALPLQSDTCYFCLYYEAAEQQSLCEHCSYGMVHGRCGRAVGNTWQALQVMKLDLVRRINSNYWTGGEMENAEHQRHQDRQVEDTGMGKA
jgi:hypothetical protein